MNESKKRKGHRRTKDEIKKQFQCPVESCEKSYGDFSSLYTHAKIKHPELPKDKIKVESTRTSKGLRGRPKIADEPSSDKNKELREADCKLCQEKQCVCPDYISESEINRTIQMLSDSDFIKFTGQIGKLSLASELKFVRNAEEHEPIFMIEDDISVINTVYSQIFASEWTASHKLKQILAFSAKYWVPDEGLIREVYLSLMVLIDNKHGLNSCKVIERKGLGKALKVLGITEGSNEHLHPLISLLKSI